MEKQEDEYFWYIIERAERWLIITRRMGICVTIGSISALLLLGLLFALE